MRQRAVLVIQLLLCLAGLILTGCPRRSEPKISVYFHENNTKKTMGIEEYLVGVVAGEMKPDWPENAYAAQAIVARTFTMEFIGRGGTKEFHNTDICTDEEHAQAYTTSAITDVIRRAVAATRGMVMTYNGEYVKGWFSASCGGRTTYARQGLAFKEAEPPYISSVTCPEGQVIPKEEQIWQADFSGDELDAALQEATGRSVGGVTKIEQLEVNEETHRTTRFRLTGPDGSAEIAAADLRVALGADRMRSIWLEDLEEEGETFNMNGRGFGHGVGLCQWGAKALAEEGKKPEDIVLHYYPKVKVEKKW